MSRIEYDDFRKMMLKRTKLLAIKVVSMVNEFPSKTAYFVIGKQIIRSATSVAANYRASLRARSQREFYAKLCIVVEECDETEFWLSFLEDADLVKSEIIKPLKLSLIHI